ncbi:MAG: CDP-alcohol phosphatidyltransferase family protein [Prevotella sp.]|nr:CDP-alcohol phosphatidyltransferase family protein [Prevotella sp.]MBQ9561386.1 CDP-alcohol phosphatidyltransferase family protein [Prevotella sp.]MBR1840291.1 CDP-alcohol phosphatidyltransferase family protein [Prevotella sp.]
MKKHIPNMITCCNLICGCIATTYAITGHPVMALLFIVLGATFDFFDGMTARLLHVSSEIGKELDSLADDVTFGVAPSAIIFYELQVLDNPFRSLNLQLSTCSVQFGEVIPYLAFIVAAFSAVRLAKFNLDTRQATSFIGLPTPANALFWGSLIAGFGPVLEQYGWFSLLIIVGIFLSSWVLVADIPMFALKFKHWGFKGNEVKYLFIAFSALVLVATIALGIATGQTNLCYSGFSIIIVAYVLVSLAVDKPKV